MTVSEFNEVMQKTELFESSCEFKDDKQGVNLSLIKVSEEATHLSLDVYSEDYETLRKLFYSIVGDFLVVS